VSVIFFDCDMVSLIINCKVSNLYDSIFFSRETIEGSANFEKTLKITPLLSSNKEKRGLALDGRLKDEDTNLASTTM